MTAGVRPLYIVNPVAGGGRGNRAVPAMRAIARDLKQTAEIVLSRAPGEALELARQGVRQGYGPIVGVGGDGTIQEVANGLLLETRPPPLGIVPVGTGNDTARSLGLPLKLEAAMRLVCHGTAGPIDVGQYGQRFFLNAGGVGFDAEVAAAVGRQRRRPWQGALPYIMAVLTELGRYRNRDLVISLDGQIVERRAVLVAIANGRYYGGGLMIAPGAVMQDGLFDVCIVGDVPRWEVLAMLPRMTTGGHIGHPRVECYRARVVSIEGAPGTRVHLDGESAGLLPAVFQIVPSVLQVMGAGRQTHPPITSTSSPRVTAGPSRHTNDGREDDEQ